ncbi:MAG TPA: HEPN domain-containing protein [Pirellulales bacterium]|jgi:HEPN domain-containing protein|nr:HEPN domain-containing protein [Pirellulales bacterium]
MGMPRDPEARRYYRAAKQRFEDAGLLLDAGRTTGAVYLAGYTVECLLKAVILESVPSKLRKQLLIDFRGRQGHDIEMLCSTYRRQVQAAIPRRVTQHLARLNSWSTDLRYTPGSLQPGDADEFFESVHAVLTWTDGRL